jgi:hypothetical protein
MEPLLTKVLSFTEAKGEKGYNGFSILIFALMDSSVFKTATPVPPFLHFAEGGHGTP